MKIKNKQYFFLKVFLFFILSTCFNQAKAESDSRFQKEYLHLLKNPNCQKGISEWKSLKDKCKIEGEYKHYFGNLYLFCKEKNKAKKMYDEAILKNDNEFSVRESEKMLVAIELGNGNYEKVKKEAERLMKKYPDWYSSYVFLGIATVFLENNYLKAKEYFDRSIELEENWEGRCWQAIVAYHQFKDYERTLELYERAMQLDMDSLFEEPAVSAAVAAAMKLGKWDSARWILNAHKVANQKLGNNVENCKNYQKLKTAIDAYDKKHVP